jgi:hypothetical protein
MKIEWRVLATVLASALPCIDAHSADFQIPDGDLARKFFESTTVSLTPVYGVMKNRSDHVATVHGFVDNAQVCTELVEVLNKPRPSVFTCQKLHDGVYGGDGQPARTPTSGPALVGVGSPSIRNAWTGDQRLLALALRPAQGSARDNTARGRNTKQR